MLTHIMNQFKTVALILKDYIITIMSRLSKRGSLYGNIDPEDIMATTCRVRCSKHDCSNSAQVW